MLFSDISLDLFIGRHVKTSRKFFYLASISIARLIKLVNRGYGTIVAQHRMTETILSTKEKTGSPPAFSFYGGYQKEGNSKSGPPDGGEEVQHHHRDAPEREHEAYRKPEVPVKGHAGHRAGPKDKAADRSQGVGELVADLEGLHPTCAVSERASHIGRTIGIRIAAFAPA